jgi:hypothetical protein
VSGNRFVFEGLAELKEALRNLPADLTNESSHIIEGAANGAVATIKGNYARGKTGNLIKGVKVEFGRSQFGASATVTSAAKHAYLYEHGTQVRHTAAGANRGVMPPAPPGRAFIPVMIRARRRMYEQLADLLKRNGLLVSGDVSGF